MEIVGTDYEKLGSFYLGREYDVESGELEEPLMLYDSKDLVTHGVVLGMTGSGKTGLCLALLEEAALDGVPALVIDPKGDIANLMLTFPEFQPADFRPWINEDDARKKGVSPDDYAARTAEMWQKGLGEWGQDGERIRRFQEKVDINVFTPGSKAGIPVSILSSLKAPPFEVVDDGELLGERIESTVSSLLSLVGVDADPIQSSEAVLLGTIFQHAWRAGQDLSLESLIRQIQQPSFDKVGVIDLESFLSSAKRQSLSLRFNNLLASPGFATWLEGPPLEIPNMLTAPDGRPRISIFSIAHLSDSERMFFVSLLLNQTLGWMRGQSGTSSLRALLYMDEIFGFLPPTANPPSKKPLMTILKQGRAFGLGTLLATQNPVDLDYKALSNTGTWFLGRLQTERDQARVLDGLEGVTTGAAIARSDLERLLAGLDSRVFLMNNVHEDGPVVFHVRWVMSYLRGPLTRSQIKTLMDPKRAALESRQAVANAIPENPMAMSLEAEMGPPEESERPLVGKGVVERFVPLVGNPEGVSYRPVLLREASVHFASAKAKMEGSRVLRFLNAIEPKGIAWAKEIPCAVPSSSLRQEPREGVDFDQLAGYAMNADNYKPVKKEFAEWIYRNERVSLFYSPLLKEYSKLGEGEGEFRQRLSLSARERRDEAVEKLRDKYDRKLKTKEDQLARAERAIEKEQAEATSATIQAGASVLGGLLGMLGGRKSRRSVLGGGARAYKQRGDVARARRRMRDLEEDLAELEAELREEVAELGHKFDSSVVELETISIKPYKKDIHIDLIALLWLPYDERGDPAW